jgi:hypothetical protein
VLKAFPSGSDNSEADDGKFRARQDAMQRLYASIIGAKAFPGLAGEKGWMWLAYPTTDAPGTSAWSIDRLHATHSGCHATDEHRLVKKVDDCCTTASETRSR